MAVFPPNLQRNIRELDRQISLLETECENMEAENREVPGKASPKQFREGPGNLPSIGGLSPTRAHAACCGRSKRTAEAGFGDVEKPESGSQWRRLEGKESGEKGEEGRREAGSESEGRYAGERGGGWNVETKKQWKHSMESVKEVTESSEGNSTGRLVVGSGRERIQADKQQERTNRKTFQETSPGRNPAELRCSSDEDSGKGIRLKTKSQNAKWSVRRPATPENRTSIKRRSRSARTRTQNSDDSPFDVNAKRAALEKEIQCGTRNEEKAEQNLNESVRVLHFLIEELRTKSTRERRNELLNDMQNVVVKIRGMKSGNSPQSVLTPPLKGSNAKSLQGGESTVELKKALIAVKKLYKEQSEEKSALAEELSKKNSTITCLKSKEKEYLSLISNMKFNLEKIKKEAEEGKLAKRELTAVKTKLREEAKVIEALKKGHGKMQELVETYVLENEKLRSEVKIGKLETRKFEVLLAGREAEIRKRKQEIELFQRQITQQLHLLRRKATENEVEHAIEAISKQANILQTDVESVPSETTLETGDPGRGGSSKGKRADVPGKEVRPSEDGAEGGNGRREGETESLKLSRSSLEGKVEGGLTSCKSEDSESEVRGGESRYNEKLHGVLTSSKTLRISINEMLKGMRRDSPEKSWRSPPNSSKTSQCSGASTYSENLSECTQKD